MSATMNYFNFCICICSNFHSFRHFNGSIYICVGSNEQNVVTVMGVFKMLFKVGITLIKRSDEIKCLEYFVSYREMNPKLWKINGGAFENNFFEGIVFFIKNYSAPIRTK